MVCQGVKSLPVKISVLGHFGEGMNLLNGQTVKTKIVTEELQNQLGQDQVLKIDTHGGWKTLLKAPFQVFSALKKSENILIFPAHNGLRVYAPLLSFQRKFFRNKQLHYVVIGGWLPQFLKKRNYLANTLKKFDGIYVETNTMKTSLNAMGFCNVYVFPNCKKLDVLSKNELIYPSETPYKLCTFSRVMKEKGIEDAVNAVMTINSFLGYQAYSLDIYGQIDSSQTEWFEELQKKFPPYIKYGGLVPFDKSVNVLKNYFALLFPTYYNGEGFAGTLIDAYSAGIPVIASDWRYNGELVNESVGYVYPTGDQIAFVDILKTAEKTPDILLSKKKLCLKEAEKYNISQAVQTLIEHIEGKYEENTL